MMMKGVYSFFLLSFFLFSFSILKGQSIQYLGSWDSNGVPTYLVKPGDAVSSGLIERINTTLPESYPVPKYHPQYISATLTDIQLYKEADVWVTFVGEGAGYRSSLGFYTYPLSSPPASAPAGVTIIFPNVSAAGSGGGLHTGDKVNIGHFPANTGIGWVLFADGFRNNAVTKGNWVLYSNPNYNPESNPDLRRHNVLFSDNATGVAVLAFEDIRRDNSSCDNDFNDVEFYITSNPTNAVSLASLTPLAGSSASQTTSGLDGGLESNGGLASAIATRNFQRKRNAKSISDEQLVFHHPENQFFRDDNDLSLFVPQQPFEFANAVISTPTDLTQITNAKYVLSVDYLIEKQRKGSILATKTEGKVYEHTKTICDRLKGAELVDVSVVNYNGLSFPMSILKDADGNTEYALAFSVIKSGDSLRLESHWTLEQYANGNTFYNFQVWSKTSLWTLETASEVLDLFKSKFKFIQDSSSVSNISLPKLYVTKGEYSNGNLNLSIKNDIAAKTLKIRGVKTLTESSTQEPFELTVTLSGAAQQDLSVPLGYVFDAGFQVINEKDAQADALYLADGAWGTDFDKLNSQVDKFDIKESESLPFQTDVLSFKRDVSCKGTLRKNGYFSLFRNLKPSSQKMDVSGYKNLVFNALGKGILEVTAVKSSVQTWENQFRAEITLDESQHTFTLPLSSFTSASGKTFVADDVTTLVFTPRNLDAAAQSFEFNLSNVRFDKNVNSNILNGLVFYAAPSITQDKSTLNFNLDERGAVQILVYNVSTGQNVYNSTKAFAKGLNQIDIDLSETPNGIYVAQIIQAKGQSLIKIVKE